MTRRVTVLLVAAVMPLSFVFAFADTNISVGQSLPLLQPPQAALTPWAILTATAGLIAFHIGLFTLVGRERKSPYIINSVYPIFLLCLIVAATALSAVLVPRSWERLALLTSAILLVSAFLWSAWNVFRIAIRAIYFVDSVKLRDLPGARALYQAKLRRDPQPTYAHNSSPIPDALKAEMIGILKDACEETFDYREELEPQALALAVLHQGQGNLVLARLAQAFLKQNYSVQYLSASRHPIEFLGYLKRHLEGNGLVWEDLRRLVVAVDAYSPHFSFTDSIYVKKDRELDSLGVTRVPSKMTYAGMHTASARAFKALPKQTSRVDRKPTLVVYEDCYALTDLESPEQYRIFVRHVMPSERMWGGMFTVFLESSQPEADWRMLQACASMTLDLRQQRARKATAQLMRKPDLGAERADPPPAGDGRPSDVAHL